MYLDKLFKENLIKDFREQMRNVVDDHEPGTIIAHALEALEEKRHGGFDIAGRELVRAYRDGFAPLFKKFNPEVAAVLETIRYADLHDSAKRLITEKMIERYPVQSLEALLRIDERASRNSSTLETENSIFLKGIHQVPQSEIAAFAKDYRNKEMFSVTERLAFLFDHSDTREKTLEILAAALTEGVCVAAYGDSNPYNGPVDKYLSEHDIYEMSHIEPKMPDKLDTSEKVLEACMCLRIGNERLDYNYETVFSSKEKVQMLNDIADSPFTKGNKLKEKVLEEVVDKILDVRYGGGALEDKMSLINDLYLSNFGEKKSVEKSSILFDLVKEKPQYATIVERSDFLSKIFAPKAVESALDGKVKLENAEEKYDFNKYKILGVVLGEKGFKNGFAKIENIDKKIVADFIEKPKTGLYGDYFKTNFLEQKEGKVFDRISDYRIATTAELQYIALALGYVPKAEPANEELSYIIKGIEQLERNDRGDLKVALDIRLSSLRQSYIELTGDSSNKLEENYNKYEKIASEIAKGISKIDEHSLAFYLSCEAPNTVMADKMSATTVEIMDRHDKENDKTEPTDTSERQDDKNDNLESVKDDNNDDTE